MSNYSSSTFINPLSSTDRTIKIHNEDLVVTHTLIPYTIKNVFRSNNLIKLNLNSDRTITLDFNSSNEAILALPILKSQIDQLSNENPLRIDKIIEKYVDGVGVTGSVGATGSQGIQGVTGATGSVGPTASISFSLQRVSDGIFVTASVGIEYWSPDQHGSIFGNVYRRYYAIQDVVGAGGSINIAHGATISRVVDLKGVFEDQAGNIWYPGNHSDYGGSSRNLELNVNGANIFYRCGSGLDTQAGGFIWMDYIT